MTNKSMAHGVLGAGVNFIVGESQHGVFTFSHSVIFVYINDEPRITIFHFHSTVLFIL